jgi:hypothetical protein
MSKDNGGPAFPSESGRRYFHGMTLRDYFAAKAMPALLLEMHQTGMAPIKGIAAVAYEMADAMLAERAK